MPSDWGKYTDAQLVGGIADGLVARLTGGEVGSVGLVAPYDWTQVAVAEVLYTFLLRYVFSSVAIVAHRRLALYAGLAFGSCVTAGGYAIGGASSGLLDPAVSFGVAFQFRAVSHYVKAGAAGDTLLNAF